MQVTNSPAGTAAARSHTWGGLLEEGARAAERLRIAETAIEFFNVMALVASTLLVDAALSWAGTRWLLPETLLQYLHQATKWTAISLISLFLVSSTLVAAVNGWQRVRRQLEEEP